MPGAAPTQSDDEADLDAQLMAGTARGETGAFEQLVRRHQRRVFNLVYRSVGNVSDAEDLVQEVFLRVYRAADRYRPTARFTTWLYRVTANVVINWLRRRERQPVELTRVLGRSEDEATSTVLVDPAKETSLEGLTREELRAEVRRAVESLPPNQRLAVLLFRFEGLSYQEIAETLACSVMAVKSLLSRARDNLRHRLARYVNTDSGFSPKHAPPHGG
jgi:RNA polymerase sigma-70 factor (ECF subfamily)